MKLCNREEHRLEQQREFIQHTDLVGRGGVLALRYTHCDNVTMFYEGEHTVVQHSGVITNNESGQFKVLNEYREVVLFEPLGIELLNGLKDMAARHTIGMTEVECARVAILAAYNICRNFEVKDLGLDSVGPTLIVGHTEYTIETDGKGTRFNKYIRAQKYISTPSLNNAAIEDLPMCIALVVSAARGAKVDDSVKGIMFFRYPNFKIIDKALEANSLMGAFHTSTAGDGTMKRFFAVDTKKKRLVRFDCITESDVIVRDTGAVSKEYPNGVPKPERYLKLVPYTGESFQTMALSEQMTVLFNLIQHVEFDNSSEFAYELLAYISPVVDRTVCDKDGQLALKVNDRYYYWNYKFNELRYTTAFDVAHTHKTKSEAAALSAAYMLDNIGEETLPLLEERIGKKAMRALVLLTGK